MKRLFLLAFLFSVTARAAVPAAPALIALEKKLATELDAQKSGSLPPEKHLLFLQEFRTEFQKAFAVAPPSSENEALRARVLVALGDQQEAVANLQSALNNQPGDPTLRVSLGRARLEGKDYAGALAEANAVLKSDPDNEAAKFLKFESQGRVASTVGGSGRPAQSAGSAARTTQTSGRTVVAYNETPKHAPVVGEVPIVQSERPAPTDGQPLPLWPLAIPIGGALIGYGIYKGQQTTTWGENAELDKATGATDEQVIANRHKAKVVVASAAVAFTLVYGLPRAVKSAPAVVAAAKSLFDRSGQSLQQVTASEVGAIGSEGSASIQRLRPLVNSEQAIIDVRKLTEYALNPAHPIGANKARVFHSALGFTSEHAEELISQIRKGIISTPATPGVVDKFGPRMTVDLLITGPSGQAVVRTGWIYDPGSTAPRLTTIFVK